MLVSAAALAVLAGCDRSGADLLPDYDNGVPSIVEIGKIQVLTEDQFVEFMATSEIDPAMDWGQWGIDTAALDGVTPQQWCTEENDDGQPRCYFGQLSSPETGYRGGATFTFDGPDDEEVTTVCIITDPETVYWTQSVVADPLGEALAYQYPDEHADDGDVDLFAGLSSYYTGSPGIELGDFRGFYTDSLGREIEIEYGLCNQTGYIDDGQHPGRAAVEYCDVDTQNRAGIEFTGVLDTYSVPTDDGAVSFGLMVVEGRCSRLPTRMNNQNGGSRLVIGDPEECTIFQESMDIDNERLVECTEKAELAYCHGNADPFSDETEIVKKFCCANPEMCQQFGIPEDVCDGMETKDDIDAFCERTGGRYCCGWDSVAPPPPEDDGSKP